MRAACKLAAEVLQYAGSLVKVRSSAVLSGGFVHHLVTELIIAHWWCSQESQQISLTKECIR